MPLSAKNRNSSVSPDEFPEAQGSKLRESLDPARARIQDIRQSRR